MEAKLTFDLADLIRNPVAWTGGGTHRTGTFRRKGMRKDFEVLTRLKFREQVKDWTSFWKGKLPLDIARVFWGRARGDAWATMRHAGWCKD